MLADTQRLFSRLPSPEAATASKEKKKKKKKNAALPRDWSAASSASSFSFPVLKMWVELPPLRPEVPKKKKILHSAVWPAGDQLQKD